MKARDNEVIPENIETAVPARKKVEKAESARKKGRDASQGPAARRSQPPQAAAGGSGSGDNPDNQGHRGGAGGGAGPGAGGHGAGNPEDHPPAEGGAAVPVDPEKERAMKSLAMKHEEFMKGTPQAGPSRLLQLWVNNGLVHLPQRFLGRTPFTTNATTLRQLTGDNIQELGMTHDMEKLENAEMVLMCTVKLCKRIQAPAQRLGALLKSWGVNWAEPYRGLPMAVALAIRIAHAQKFTPGEFFAFSEARLDLPYEDLMQFEEVPDDLQRAVA